MSTKTHIIIHNNNKTRFGDWMRTWTGHRIFCNTPYAESLLLEMQSRRIRGIHNPDIQLFFVIQSIKNYYFLTRHHKSQNPRVFLDAGSSVSKKHWILGVWMRTWNGHRIFCHTPFTESLLLEMQSRRIRGIRHPKIHFSINIHNSNTVSKHKHNYT